MVKLIDVTKKYEDGTVALDDVSLEVKPKEFIFLVGKSGAGKTTLLRLIVREELPTKGKVFVDGEDSTLLKERDVPNLRRKIGYIFQDFRLIETRTAFENVALALEVAGAREKDINSAVPRYLDYVGLKGRMNHYPKQLSGGEKQRLAIARALVREPKLILADEPTGMIDPTSSWEILELLEKVTKWGTTVIMATHDFSIVNSMKKRVVELEKGKIVRDQKKASYSKS